MPEHQDIPQVCFELLEALHEHGEPMPLRLLPEKLRDLGLLKVCQHYGLIGIVRWYEGVSGSSSGNAILVGSPPGWLPFYRMGRSSLQQAIEKDAENEDVRMALHVQLSRKGDLLYETLRLSEPTRQGRAPAAASNIAGQPKTRGGRPPNTDRQKDRRISEAWEASGCRSFEEFAQSDAGGSFELPASELRRAHERHRKRQARRISS